MVTTIKNPTTGDVLPQFTMYRYDQLNRLKNMKAFADFDFSNNEWNYSGYDGRYFNEFTYDGNGNIETALAKNANGDVIDNQVYNYYKPGNNKQNNRLYSIFDDAAITSGKDLPSGQIAFDDEDLLNNNYRYNELGELVYDKQMGIDEITWGNNGKIQSVTHSDASGKYKLKYDTTKNYFLRIFTEYIFLIELKLFEEAQNINKFFLKVTLKLLSVYKLNNPP